jgi:hypothetical protein
MLDTLHLDIATSWYVFDFLASAHVVLLCDPRGSVHDLDTIPSVSIWSRRSLEWSSLEARRSLVENALHINTLGVVHEHACFEHRLVAA